MARRAGGGHATLFAMPRKSQPVFVTRFPVHVSRKQDRLLLQMLRALTWARNAMLAEFRRRLLCMRRDPRYRQAIVAARIRDGGNWEICNTRNSR